MRCNTNAQSKLPTNTPRFNVTSAVKPPVIDGALDDACWKDAPVYTIKSKKDGDAANTEFKITADDKALYIASKCHEPRMNKIKAKHKEHDGPIWQDDSLELFVSPRPGRSEFYHFICNTLETKTEIYEGRSGISYNSRWGRKSKKIS